MNGSSIEANEKDLMRATKIRTGREKKAQTETWKWNFNEWEVRTVDVSEMGKQASKGHDLESQDRIGKPKVKIKDL